MFLINPVWKTQDLLIKLEHEGVHFDRWGSFWPTDIFAKYLDFDFHMYVYGTLLEIFERYFEIEASRVSHLFLRSFPKINIPTGSEENKIKESQNDPLAISYIQGPTCNNA